MFVEQRKGWQTLGDSHADGGSPSSPALRGQPPGPDCWDPVLNWGSFSVGLQEQLSRTLKKLAAEAVLVR